MLKLKIQINLLLLIEIHGILFVYKSANFTNILNQLSTYLCIGSQLIPTNQTLVNKTKVHLAQKNKFVFHHCHVKQFKIKCQRLLFVLYYFNSNMDMNEKKIIQVRTYVDMD